MEMDKKLEKVGQAFCIEVEYVDFEKIKVSNVKQAYKVIYRRGDGSLKTTSCSG